MLDYSIGITQSNGTDRKDRYKGTLTWKVDINAPDNLEYVCAFHGGMGGRIIVKTLLFISDLVGPQGDTGAQGPQGIEGPQGPQGIAGPQGGQDHKG